MRDLLEDTVRHSRLPEECTVCILEHQAELVESTARLQDECDALIIENKRLNLIIEGLLK